MEEVVVQIRCSEDDCPLNRKYDGFVVVGGKKLKFNADSIKAIASQLEANGMSPTFTPLGDELRAMLEARSLGLKTSL